MIFSIRKTSRLRLAFLEKAKDQKGLVTEGKVFKLGDVLPTNGEGELWVHEGGYFLTKRDV